MNETILEMISEESKKQYLDAKKCVEHYEAINKLNDDQEVKDRILVMLNATSDKYEEAKIITNVYDQWASFDKIQESARIYKKLSQEMKTRELTVAESKELSIAIETCKYKFSIDIAPTIATVIGRARDDKAKAEKDKNDSLKNEIEAMNKELLEKRKTKFELLKYLGVIPETEVFDETKEDILTPETYDYSNSTKLGLQESHEKCLKLDEEIKSLKEDIAVRMNLLPEEERKLLETQKPAPKEEVQLPIETPEEAAASAEPPVVVNRDPEPKKFGKSIKRAGLALTNALKGKAGKALLVVAATAAIVAGFAAGMAFVPEVLLGATGMGIYNEVNKGMKGR